MLLEQSLTRDLLGRVTDVTETVDGATHATHYDYDAAGRLERVSVDGAQLRRYEYDLGQPGNGNRTREFGPGDELLASAGYDAQDRMQSYGTTSYAYTAAGELTRRASPADTLSTTYDALGNLVLAGLKAATTSGPEAGMTVGTLLTYQVDGQNRRVRKLVNGEPVRGWLYRDGLAVGAELDGAGALLNRYVYATHGHVPDVLLRGDTAYRVVTDPLGSVRAVVRASDGMVVQRRDYDAWGVVTREVAPEFQSLGYAGGLEDGDTKLVRFGARDYEPSVGRWTCKDPAQLEPSSTYEYAGNAPIFMLDPNGMETVNAHYGGPPSPQPGSFSDIWKTETENERWARRIGKDIVDACGDPVEVNTYIHAKWLRILTERYGPLVAYIVSTAKEANDFRKGQTWKETKHDLSSNWKGITDAVPPFPQYSGHP